MAYLSKSIEEIENDYWGKIPDDASYLIQTVYQLRKKKLNELTIEDLRILISQNIALTILIPLAIDKLKSNLFAEGDFYPGDLLKSVLTSDENFWKNNIKFKNQILELCADKISNIIYVEVSDRIRDGILNEFELFKK